MQNSARFFAYSTWVIMISLGIIIFTHRFLDLTDETFWIGLLAKILISFLYFNLTYAAVKRFIKKVPAPTNLHMLLSLFIYLPPVIFIFALRDAFHTNDLLFSAIMTAGCALGMVIGNKAGIKARFEYIQKLKEYQSNTN